ncbi:MAG: hypothetical protein IKT16_09495 [Desulfovibrio sp.]|nr:hypothetical protein [Desulfovibrio sp.]
MSVLNGCEAAQARRALDDPAKASVFNACVMANAFDEDKQGALGAGMQGHLAEPAGMARLGALLQKKMQPGRQNARGDAPDCGMAALP